MPIPFITYRQPRGLNQGNTHSISISLHLTSGDSSAIHKDIHWLAGQQRWTRSLTEKLSSARRQENLGLTLQSNWASPATQENREYPDCSYSPFSNWACHPKLQLLFDSSCRCRLHLPPKKNHEFADCSCSPVAFRLGLPPKNFEFPDRSATGFAAEKSERIKLTATSP